MVLRHWEWMRWRLTEPLWDVIVADFVYFQSFDPIGTPRQMLVSIAMNPVKVNDQKIFKLLLDIKII